MIQSTEINPIVGGGNEGIDRSKSVVEKTHIFLLFAFHGVIVLEQFIVIVWLFRQGKEPSSVPIFGGGLVFTNLLLTACSAFLLFHFRKIESENILLKTESIFLNRSLEDSRGKLDHSENLTSQERAASLKFNSEISKNRKNIAYVHTNYCGEVLGRVFDKNIENISNNFQAYLSRILEETAQLFTLYTGSKCASCIKIFEGSKGDINQAFSVDGARTHLKTLARNPGSEADRIATDNELKIFDYHKNTAFHRICASNKSPHYFVDNSLETRAEMGDYDNENPNWKKLYNASAVVPVRPPNAPVEAQSVGFLCVDNRDGGFDMDRCVSILDGIASDLYFGINATTSVLEHIRKNGG